MTANDLREAYVNIRFIILTNKFKTQALIVLGAITMIVFYLQWWY